jgi:hypothetical protein
MTEEQTTRKGRGPGKKPAKVHITMRVPRHVYDYFDGSKIEMRAVLEEHVNKNMQRC